ncbi:probable receptor-like protein kinase At5g38990 [Hibiscus syriacus]|uniref:probable receptor-like protein kinase At5g38990 n=1 Tax=Hibiscus syriacus TaxID=106335 RepID=UPI00192311AF|nr:probable receptor-like protein kinase At5g38990 [Hibiscus syriacus]
MVKISPIVVGAAAAVVFVAVVMGFFWFYKSCKSFSNSTSETGSSDPSALAGWNRGAGPSSSADQSSYGPQGARQFVLEELEQATKRFSESNLIGYGSFGLVYKGLLRDIVVAIKRHPGAPRSEFVAGVTYLSEIRHRNVVSLLGYCQESGSQVLVYEYLPNGSMCNHLYDTGRDAPTRLEFKQRLSIALGAARGLCHLHGLKPPLIHKNFKTANVLVDEDFIAKVADAGASVLLEKIEEVGPSYTSSANVFRDPEVEVSGSFTESSDVYSFGVFLLELVTGQEQAVHRNYLRSNESLIQWVQSRLRSNDFVDSRLAGSFTMDGIRELIKLTLQCMSFPRKRRPDMNTVSVELERIHEKEMEMTTVRGEGTAKITLGSELFASI